jgi:hypothetical protein
MFPCLRKGFRGVPATEAKPLALWGRGPSPTDEPGREHEPSGPRQGIGGREREAKELEMGIWQS